MNIVVLGALLEASIQMVQFCETLNCRCECPDHAANTPDEPTSRNLTV